MIKPTALCYLLLLLIGRIPMALADPFNQAQRQVIIEGREATIMHEQKQCQTEKPYFFQDSAWKDLRLIGLLEQGGHWRAFFMNQQQHIVLLQQGDWLSEEGVEIVAINPQEVQLLKRENPQNCQQTSRIILKL